MPAPKAKVDRGEEWAGTVGLCQRRIQRWRVPRNWSTRGWLEEIAAHATAAACQAKDDFDPARGVPFPAFLYQRVLASALTRYRQEWAFAARCCSNAIDDVHESEIDRNMSAYPSDRFVSDLLSQLPELDRWLIEQLFWADRTEAEISRQLGVTQQAVSKRKRAVLRDLHARLNSAEQNSEFWLWG